MTLIVCPLSQLGNMIVSRAPSHLITLLSPHDMIMTPAGIDPERHLRVGVDDIASPVPGLIAPNAALVEGILAFGQSWDEQAPMLVHCWAGISRSTATAFVLACERNPGVDELVIARAMRMASPHAFPNRRIVALADDILDRRGRMLEAVEAMGASNLAMEGVPFDLAARHAP